MSFSLIYEPESNARLLFNVSSGFRTLEWSSLTAAFNYPVKDIASWGSGFPCADQTLDRQLKNKMFHRRRERREFAYRGQKPISGLVEDGGDFSDTQEQQLKCGWTRGRAPWLFVSEDAIISGLVDDVVARPVRKSRLTWRRRFHFRRATSTYVGSWVTTLARDTLRKPPRQRTYRARSVRPPPSCRFLCSCAPTPSRTQPYPAHCLTRRCWSATCKADPRERQSINKLCTFSCLPPPSLSFAVIDFFTQFSKTTRSHTYICIQKVPERLDEPVTYARMSCVPEFHLYLSFFYLFKAIAWARDVGQATVRLWDLDSPRNVRFAKDYTCVRACMSFLPGTFTAACTSAAADSRAR